MTRDLCPPPERVNILGVGVSALNMTQALNHLECLIKHDIHTYIVVCPVYTVMNTLEDPALRRIVNGAGLVTPDGMPLVILSRMRGYRDVGRVYGPDIMLAFSKRAAAEGYSNYYYGGAPGVADALADELSSRFPSLPVAGTFSPPFHELSDDDEAEIVAMINEAAPDIVWIGLGSPKQDYWMVRFRERLNAPILIGVGAAFDYISGRVPQAPRWMQRMALEWFFRLIVEPGRLWRRYLIYNPLFLWNVFLQETGLKRWSIGED